MLPIAPGARVLIRDEEWLVSRIDHSSDGGRLLVCDGVSELVRGRSTHSPSSSARVSDRRMGEGLGPACRPCSPGRWNRSKPMIRGKEQAAVQGTVLELLEAEQ
jgi:hypothetical protein